MTPVRSVVSARAETEVRAPSISSKAVPSRVASYNDNRLLGSNRTTAQENFDASHELYRLIAELAAIRKGQPALRRGHEMKPDFGRIGKRLGHGTSTAGGFSARRRSGPDGRRCRRPPQMRR